MRPRRYDVRPDGRVDVYLAVGPRWVFERTAARDSYSLPSDVRTPCNRLESENAARRQAVSA